MFLCYVEKKAKAGKRRRTNPEVPFAAALEKIVNKLSAVQEYWPFCKPVSSKDVPDYYNLIKFSMDLQTMKDNIRKHKYETRQQFTEHVNLIVNNCITYNGFNSELTKTAQRMLEMSNKEINQNSQALEKLEHEINPLLGDDPQAALSFLCRKSIERMKAVPNSWPFHFPVSSKKLPDYRMIITKPMDLQTM
ncbi:PREDICTED: transcription initiation factor TFIID subunit 1-like, partial [Amphimedon queenslandica]|uniref:Bromo domain-containing protein n=1 Tax=Amphimedon queenslandica TaxID=400682 RepID=A0AAN0JTU7_AMPQE